MTGKHWSVITAILAALIYIAGIMPYIELGWARIEFSAFSYASYIMEETEQGLLGILLWGGFVCAGATAISGFSGRVSLPFPIMQAVLFVGAGVILLIASQGEGEGLVRAQVGFYAILTLSIAVLGLALLVRVASNEGIDLENRGTSEER